MRFTPLLLFLLLSNIVNAQKQLAEVQPFPIIIKSTDGIIYGSFFDRTGYNTFGFPQSVTILNQETNKKYVFIARTPFDTRQEARFIYYIKAGRYSILNYTWTERKAYGGKIRTEEVYNAKGKDLSTTDRYCFTVEAGKVTYIGAWHFETTPISFAEEKTKVDSVLQTKYRKISLSEAKIDLPK